MHASDDDGGGRPASTLEPGSVLGPDRIAAVLGRGGMGVVYEAAEIDSGRRVALKVLSPGLQRDVNRLRFLREGRLAASLNHPHCVYAFGAWEIEGRLVIAMELMCETLTDRTAWIVDPSSTSGPSRRVSKTRLRTNDVRGLRTFG